MTVAELRSRMSSREMRHWAVLESIEPWGEMGHYLRSATLCSLLANIHRDPKRSKEFKPADFMPILNRSEQQTERRGMSLDEAFEFMWAVAVRNDKKKGLIN